MLGMTPAQTRANGLGNPSLPQLWLTAMLCLFVELVRNVASTFQMRSFPLKRDWHTPDDEAALPRVKTDTHQETKPAAPTSHTRNGSVNRVHASPAKAGVQSSSDKSARSAPNLFAPSLASGSRRGCVLNKHASKP